MYAHNAPPDVTQTYGNRVLIKNWAEDRYQNGGPGVSLEGTTAAGLDTTTMASTSGRSVLTSKERVLPGTPKLDAPVFETTKQAADKSRLTAPPPANVKKPSMFTEGNFEERLATYGLTPEINYTIGPNALTEAARPKEHHLTTTNKLFYEQMPEAARAASPDTFRLEAAKHGVTNICERSIAGEASDQVNTAGGKGARGEITRRPGEAGNVYGVSVFVDEYAKWGTALKGVPLDETVKKMQTKYF